MKRLRMALYKKKNIMEKDKRTTLKRRTAGVLKKNSVQINTEFCNADNWCPINLYKSGLFFVIERVVCFFL